MRRTRPVWYVGVIIGGGREVFRWWYRDEPKPNDNLRRFCAVIGPHMTKRGAEFMRDSVGNPHCDCAPAADRIARSIARGL